MPQKIGNLGTHYQRTSVHILYWALINAKKMLFVNGKLAYR